MSSKTPTTPSRTAVTQYTPHKIGSGSHTATVSLCGAPKNDATVAMKGNALQYLIVTLEPHSCLFPLSDLIAPLHTIIPTAIYTAEHEAMDVGNRLCQALLNPDTATMSGIAFYNSNANIVQAKMDVSKREGALKHRMEYIKVTSSVSLSEYNASYKSVDTVSVEFYLALPQNPVTSVSPAQLFPNGTPRKGILDSSDDEATCAAIPQSMRKAIDVDASEKGTTYTGIMDFLSNSINFQAVFTEKPEIYKLHQRQFTVIEPSEMFKSVIRPVVWKVFCDNIWMDYVGTDPSEKVTAAITARTLRSFKCNDWDPVLRRPVILTPDDVMQQYLQVIPLLQAHKTNTWGFHLFSLFLDALPYEVREVLEDSKSPYYFEPPELTAVKTYSDQMRHLRAIHRVACSAYAVQMASDARIRKVSKSGQSSPPQPQPIAQAFPAVGTPVTNPVVTAAYVSPAETTIVRYQPPDYPTDPANQFKSIFARGFLGCLGCGDERHRFRACPQRDTKEIKDIFHKNYLAHFPDRRKRNDDGSQYQGFLGQGPSQVPRILVTTGLTFVTTEVAASKPRPMPIAINNRLPTADFRLVTKNLHPCLDLGCLVDSCGGLNSGYLDFHCYIRDTYPECVVAYETFDDSNPFHPIKLGGALTNQNQFEESNYGHLTAVITYRTQYTHPETKMPILLKFALGADVSVNSLCGAPMLRDLGAVIDLGSSKLHLTKVSTTLPLVWSEVKRGAPEEDKHNTNHVRFSLPPLPVGPPPLPPAGAVQFNTGRMRNVDNTPAWMSVKRQSTPATSTNSAVHGSRIGKVTTTIGADTSCPVFTAVIAIDNPRLVEADETTIADISDEIMTGNKSEISEGAVTEAEEIYTTASFSDVTHGNRYNTAQSPAQSDSERMSELSNTDHQLDFWKARLTKKQS